VRKLLTILLLLISLSLFGQTFYVSPSTGNDSDSGLDTTNAWATWQKAFSIAEAGDTVYFRGGVWYPTNHAYQNGVTFIDPTNSQSLGAIGHNGTAESPVCFFNYPGETPILDCSKVDLTAKTYNEGLCIAEAQYLKFKGLTIRNVWQKGESIQCFGIYAYAIANIEYENITVNTIAGVGIRHFGWIGTGVDEYGFTADTSSWTNCDVYNCFDTINIGDDPGNAADGWKVNNNYDPDYGGCYFTFTNCRAWKCSDDGFDPSGSGIVVFNNNWSFSNGVVWLGSQTEGNGFKSGGVNDSLTYPTRYAYQNISAYNLGNGYYDLEYPNYYRNRSWIHNNIFYKNDIGISISANNLHSPDSTYSWYRNNIVYGTRTLDGGSRPYNLDVSFKYAESHNTWDYGEPGSLPHWTPTDTVTVTDADFILINDSITITNQLRAARKSNGNLPDITAFRLSSDSDLKDAGTNVGMSTTPDIGIDWDYYNSQYPSTSKKLSLSKSGKWRTSKINNLLMLR
jgi:hypothetical protein